MRSSFTKHAVRREWPLVLRLSIGLGLTGCGDVTSETSAGATPPSGNAVNPIPGALAPTSGTTPSPSVDGNPGSTASTTPNPTPSVGSSNGDTTTPPTTNTDCAAVSPGRTPLRRLTRFEYSQTLAALLGDATNSGQRLPAEVLGNGFANDADAQPTSPFLVEQYAAVAHDVAAAALTDPNVVATYDGCVAQDPVDENACARSFVAAFAELAYRRPLIEAELTELLSLQQALRSSGDFVSSITGVVEAVLQSPDFLYRIERGEEVATGLRKPTGYEMATRLSYFLWGAPPDDELREAAKAGQLQSSDAVLAQATRLLDDERARRQVSFFFDSYLPINALSDQTRDAALFPAFGPRIGSLMHEETTRFLHDAIFETSGTWNDILTAPYSFMNEELAEYYGIEGVVGAAFQKVDVDATRRPGLLTHGSIMTGTTVTNVTNPVRRGGFILHNLLCTEVPLPPAELADKVKPPEPYSAPTGRDRYSAHSRDPLCAGCHAILDPPGFALENFDAVGQWRDQENAVTIDASGELSLLGAFNGPAEFVHQLAQNERTHQCFVHQWLTFAYGRSLDSGDTCNEQKVVSTFANSGHQVRQLLIDVTQSDGFLYIAPMGAN